MTAILVRPAIDKPLETVKVVVALAKRDQCGNFVKDEFGEETYENVPLEVPLEVAEMRYCSESLRIQIEYLGLIPEDCEIQGLTVVDCSEDEEF